MIPSFLELQAQISELDKSIQELTSAVYVIHNHDDVFEFVSYYDKETQSMEFTMLCGNIEVKMFDSIPTSVLLAYSDFIRLVQSYQRGDTSFPFTTAPKVETDPDPEIPLSKLEVPE